MCQEIIQFCNGSTKLLLLVGAVLSLLLSVAIGYTACTTHALYNLIDFNSSQSSSIGYYLQLGAAFYLFAMTVLSCVAAHFDQKHLIRTLAVISSLNCILALAAVLMVPTGQEVIASLRPTLQQAVLYYDFTAPYPNITLKSDKSALMNPIRKDYENSDSGQALNSTAGKEHKKRIADGQSEMRPENGTQIWDGLQSRGCCGLENATSTWTTPHKIPKSCCLNPTQAYMTYFCEKPDDHHQQGCLELIGNTSLTLYIVLILIALVNLYLATIAGISTYKTLHYSEASQSAYT